MALDMQAAVRISASVTGGNSVDQLRSSLDRVSNTAGGMAGKFSALGNTLKGLAVAFGVVQFATFTKDVISSIAALDDMSEKTGATVENLSALARVAKISGVDMETVADSLVKMTKSLKGADKDSKGAAEALKYLGINFAEFKKLDPAEQMLMVAKELDKFKDSAGKTALALDLFGKSGANMLPYLKDLAEEGELNAKVTADQAAMAETLEKNIARLQSSFMDMGKSLSIELMPQINSFVEGLRDGLVEAGKFGDSRDLQDFAKTGALALAALLDVMIMVGKTLRALFGSFETVYADLVVLHNYAVNGVKQVWSEKARAQLKAALDERNRIVEEANKRYKELWNYNGTAFYDAVKKRMEQPQSQGFPVITNQKKQNAEYNPVVERTEKLTEAQKEAAKAEQERTRILQGLSDELLRLSLGEQALTIDKMRRLGATDEEITRLKALLQQQQVLKNAAEETEQAERDKARALQDTIKERYREIEDQAQSARQVFESVRTPLEIYNAEIERLAFLLRDGAISQETFGRATKQAAVDLKNAGKGGDDMMKALQTAVQGFGRQATDALVDFAFGVKGSFSDMATAVLKDISRMVIQMMVMKPLMNSIGGFMGFADGGVFTGGAVQPFADGGIVSKPTIFPMANGTGLMGEAGPEAIMPLRRTSSGALGVIAQGGGGQVNNVTVNVSVSGDENTKADTNTGAALGTVITRAIQSELLRQKRPGGLLAA